jgi:hypothetical protein
MTILTFRRPPWIRGPKWTYELGKRVDTLVVMVDLFHHHLPVALAVHQDVDAVAQHPAVSWPRWEQCCTTDHG